jgi:hypothetical protein
MPSPDTLAEQAVRNAERYLSADGFANILIGIYLVILGAIGYFWAFSIIDPEKHPPYSIAYLLWIYVAVLMRPTVAWLKHRITYPRTGYAVLPDISRPDTGFFAPPIPTSTELQFRLRSETTAKWCTTLYLLSYVYLLLWHNRWLCVPMGIVLGYIWRRQHSYDEPTWVIPGTFAAIGVGAAMFPLQEKFRLTAVIFLFGAIYLFDGVCKLIIYLRQNPAALAKP